MNWILVSVGILLTVLSMSTWCFRPVDWLTNAPKGRGIIDKEKAARLAGSYLCWIGMCFIVFGYAVENFSDQAIIMIVACYIPVNMVVLVSYLVAHNKNIR